MQHKTTRFVLNNLPPCLLFQILTSLDFDFKFHSEATVVNFYSGGTLTPVCATVSYCTHLCSPPRNPCRILTSLSGFLFHLHHHHMGSTVAKPSYFSGLIKTDCLSCHGRHKRLFTELISLYRNNGFLADYRVRTAADLRSTFENAAVLAFRADGD